LDAIEKSRKVLSANQESTVSCEYLMEDVDFNLSLQREQFVSLIENTLVRFNELL
jgi:molecular chaperone DnaK (HSP70)